MDRGRISVGLGACAAAKPLLRLVTRSGPVLVGSVCTGGRARTPGGIWPSGAQPVIRKLSLPPLGA